MPGIDDLQQLQVAVQFQFQFYLRKDAKRRPTMIDGCPTWRPGSPAQIQVSLPLSLSPSLSLSFSPFDNLITRRENCREVR
mmetsp:Transcript_61121/g.129104  ORF Transcript_61121/g.129104 Transcript_61121/m.129104 type:complete len:81 (-) Transcript_61121:456-698(-)